MSGGSDEADLVEARRLRDLARAIVRTDMATLRADLGERSLASRARDQVIGTAVDTAEKGVDLALENKALLALTLTGVTGWLFREPLGALGHRCLTWVERRWLSRRV
jgi:hypothetical protein